MRTSVAASILLPQYAAMKSLAKWVNFEGDISARRDLLQLTDTISRRCDTLIGILVARSMALLAVQPPGAVREMHRDEMDRMSLQSAKDLGNELRAHRIASTVPSPEQIISRIHVLVPSNFQYLWDDPDLRALSPVPYSVWALAAMLAIVPLAGLCWLLLARSVVPMQVLPNALAFSVFALADSIGGPEGVFGFAVMALASLHLLAAAMKLPKSGAIALTVLGLALSVFFAVIWHDPSSVAIPIIAAFFALGACLVCVLVPLEKRSQWAIIASHALGFLSGVMSFFWPLAAFPAIAYFGTFFLSRLFEKRGNSEGIRWFSLSVFVVGAGTLGGLYLWYATADANGTPIYFAIACFLAIGLLCVLGNRKTLTASVSASLLLFSLTYLVTVGLDVRRNTKDRSIFETFVNSADQTRQKAAAGGLLLERNVSNESGRT